MFIFFATLNCPVMNIIIIPDTNVFIKRLDIISDILNDKHSFNVQVLVLKLVLNELDKLKIEINAAKIANSFLIDNLNNETLKIEGEMQKNGMDVEITYPKFDKNMTIDDKIIRTALVIKNSVLLTSDKNMFVKCKGENVKCVYVNNKSYSDMKLEIYIAQTAAEPMDITYEVYEPSYKEQAVNILRPMTVNILKNAIGPGYGVIYEDQVENGSIEDLINICIDNFPIFSEYVHRSSKNLLISIRKLLKESKQDSEKKQALQNLITLFRINKKL